MSCTEKILAWWKVDKGQLRRSTTNGISDSIVSEFKSRFDKMIDILTWVIIPRLSLEKKIDSGLKASLENLIKELSEYGISTLALECAALSFFPKKRKDLFLRIEHGLMDSSKQQIEDGVRAIDFMRLDDRSLFKSSEILRVLNILSVMICWRNPTRLPVVLGIVSMILPKYFSLMRKKNVASILIGLGHLSKETAMDCEKFEISERLEIRVAAAGLAYQLYTIYEKQDETIPTVLETWRTICQSDAEFSEVRNEWLILPTP